MYVNDPSEKALLPEIFKPAEDILEEPRHYSEFFYDDQPEPGMRMAGYSHGLHTQICRFDQEGNHVTMAKDCTHFDQADEEGPKIQKGWTAQVG